MRPLPPSAQHLARPLVALVGDMLLFVALVRLVLTIGGALAVFADYHADYRAAANLRLGHDLYAEGRLLVGHAANT